MLRACCPTSSLSLSQASGLTESESATNSVGLLNNTLATARGTDFTSKMFTQRAGLYSTTACQGMPMKRTRRIKITTTHRRTMRLLPPAVRAFCPVCACEVETLSAPEAAARLGVELDTFNRLLAAGQLHTMATASGSLRVCPAPLPVPTVVEKGEEP